MGKDWLSVQIVRARASVYGVQIGSRADDSGAVIILHYYSMDVTDDHRSIVIANNSTPMMNAVECSALDGRHGKVGC